MHTFHLPSGSSHSTTLPSWPFKCGCDLMLQTRMRMPGAIGPLAAEVSVGVPAAAVESEAAAGMGSAAAVSTGSRFAAFSILPVPSSIRTFQRPSAASHSTACPSCPFSSGRPCRPRTRTREPRATGLPSAVLAEVAGAALLPAAPGSWVVSHGFRLAGFRSLPERSSICTFHRSWSASHSTIVPCCPFRWGNDLMSHTTTRIPGARDSAVVEAGGDSWASGALSSVEPAGSRFAGLNIFPAPSSISIFQRPSASTHSTTIPSCPFR
mmetsp:Transcript_24211/g.76140  ORF Transcript_24211/g.76140 Transcript_24211/m.76140 type:complete len:267 (+) Transcript_24211:290-1090(+)